MQVKQDLSYSIPRQIEQGSTVGTMSRVAMSGAQPLIDSLDTANTDLQAKQAAAEAKRQEASESRAALRDAARTQRTAFSNLAGHVNTVADGSAAFILSTGYGVRANPAPKPPIEDAPGNVRTRINGVPGQVTVIWKGVAGARNYEVQYSLDLSGATGWTTVAETPGGGRLSVGGLTSGTRYVFRVRGYGNAQPGPWSSPVPQIAP